MGSRDFVRIDVDTVPSYDVTKEENQAEIKHSAFDVEWVF